MAGKTAEPEIVRATPAGDNLGGALELIGQGAALIRIENETMMQVAVQRPRDEAEVIKGAMKELDLVPEEAGKAFYSIPYKERQPDGSTRITKVEGPSVKAAMALARRWGNCTTGARILNEDKEGFDVEGIFIDLETNFRITRPQRVSKWYKPRGGGQQLLSVDRQLMAVQSGASKCIRNAILAALPAYLVSAYDKKARAIAGGKLDAPADAKTIDAVLRAFEKWQVTKAQLEQYSELPVEKWTGTEVADLRGLWNAISDGQTTVAEVWPPKEEGPAPGSTGAATVTPETLMAGTATGQDGSDPAKRDEKAPEDKPLEEKQADLAWGEEQGAEQPKEEKVSEEPQDPRPSLIAEIEKVKAKFEKQPPPELWRGICREVCGLKTTPESDEALASALATVDPAALDDLLSLAKGINSKDGASTKRVNEIVAKVKKAGAGAKA